MKHLGIGLVLAGLIGTVPLLFTITRTRAASTSGAGISVELFSRPRQLASTCLLAAVHGGVEPSVHLADRCVEAASAVFAATNR